MASRNGGGVFKSASTGILRPKRGAEPAEDADPLAAVLNRSWMKKPGGDQDGRKRGIAARRGLQAELMGLSTAPTPAKAGDKNRLSNGFEDESPARAEGVSPAGRGGNNMPAPPPVRRYQFEVCPDELLSPQLRSPPAVRKGQVKLVHDDDLKDALHGQSEVDDHRPHMDPEQEHFVDLAHKLQGLVNQAALRLVDMLTKIRNHYLEDKAWLDSKINYDQLTEIAFEVQTANYHLAKWHHQLAPKSVAAPVHPSKVEDMASEDILAQALYSTSSMEVLVGKLAPLLNNICHDAKTLRRAANGEPLSPTSKNAYTLAQKRGFKDVNQLDPFMSHLEHTLAVAQHLATPPTSGLPKMKSTVTTIIAASKFKRLLGKPKSSEAAPAKESISGAFKSLAASVNEVAGDEEEQHQDTRDASKQTTKSP